MKSQALARVTPLLAIPALLASSSIWAGSLTNTMTNIVTVDTACSIVAIGVDFGIVGFPLPTAGVTSTYANTSAGNAATGNTSNPDSGKDGGAANNDVLSLDSPIPGVTTALNSLLSSMNTTAPGVYVACTTPPIGISLISAAVGAVTYPLPVATLGVPTGTFGGKMTGIGGGATSSNSISYTLGFQGTPVATSIPPISVFTASFLATGIIPSVQIGTVVPGFYGDVAVASVNF